MSLPAPSLDPLRPYMLLLEREPMGKVLPDLESVATHVDVQPVMISTVFLTASTCPIGCNMCDLHRNTLSGATPLGAIPRQIRYAKDQLGVSDAIKLYNSGNFFDPKSIPIEDYAEIAALCESYRRVIVENHPRFGIRQHESFRDLLSGQLEIAVGLESVQPGVLKRIGKRMTRDDFDGYARRLREMRIDLRVFLMVGFPKLTVQESFRWTLLSLRHAIAQGARHVSLIPARPGNGWNGEADRLPHFSLTELIDLYHVAIETADKQTCVTVDLWDVESCDDDQHLVQEFAEAMLYQRAVKRTVA